MQKYRIFRPERGIGWHVHTPEGEQFWRPTWQRAIELFDLLLHHRRHQLAEAVSMFKANR